VNIYLEYVPGEYPKNIPGILPDRNGSDLAWSPLRGNYSFTYRVSDEVGFLMNIKFIHETGFIPFNGFGADDEY
jgi:hypothetical protein